METSGQRPVVWDRALQVATIVVGASGVFFIIFRGATAALFKRLVYGTAADPITGGEAANYTQFVYGVLGAVMVGWAVALWFMVIGPLRRRERWAWNAIAASLSTWFVVDSTHSVLSGFGENAILNVAFAVLFAVPLVALRGEFVDVE